MTSFCGLFPDLVSGSECFDEQRKRGKADEAIQEVEDLFKAKGPPVQKRTPSEIGQDTASP